MDCRAIPFLLLTTLLVRGESGVGGSTGPRFVTEPPLRVEFTNSTGALVPCGAEGRPAPLVSWTLGDGRRVPPGAAVEAGADGSLRFPPFPGDGFRRGVHDAAYRCRARNPSGTVVSREVHVQAVVQRRYSVQVYDEFVVRGNTAVLRCQVPAFVARHVDFVWKGGGEVIVPATPTAGGRHSVLRSGELHIRGVTPSDGQRQYACETRHRLTGEVVTSHPASGNLFVTEPHGLPSAPKMVDYRPAMSAVEGESVEMACAALSFPPPTYRWYREESEGVLLPVSGSRQLDGSLFLQFVGVEDGGRYACVANNSAGEDRAFTVLAVSAPLSVSLEPRLQVSQLGGRAVFNCTVSGRPVSSVVWLKDGRTLDTAAVLPSPPNDGPLRVHHSVTSVGRGDVGMYQCLASNDADSAQATAELRLGDVSPVLVSTFSGQRVRPGASVSLRCVAAGNPTPQVTWFLDDAPLPPGPRLRVGDFVTAEGGEVVSHVNVTEARTEDGGEYRCSADNGVASGGSRSRSHSARLDVLGPPLVRPMPDSVTAVAGRTFRIRCPAAGYPLDSVLWKKDGSPLPTHHRQRLESVGVLVIEDVQRGADEGLYTCEARAPDDTVARGRTALNVLVPPALESVLLPETLYAEEGKRTRLVCSVTQGDPPVRIEWRRDDGALPPDLETQNLEDSAMLLFRRTEAARHSGNYTCTASNAAATVNRTVRLLVNVPPRWSVEPSDGSAVVGESVVLDCSADGRPPPTVLWKKAEGDLEFREVSDHPQRLLLSNGSLRLRDVSEGDAGHYLCRADNGVGAGLSKVVILQVHAPPRFESKFSSRAVQRGRDAELRCEARGEPEIRIQWEKDKQPLHPQGLNRLSEVTEAVRNGSDLTVSRLLIRGAGRSDSALYTCVATNDFGRDETNVQLVVQEPPSSPVDLVVRDKSSRSLTLGWTPSFSGNSPVLGYVLEYSLSPRDGDDQQEQHQESSSLRVPGTETSAVVRGLRPASPYRLRVSAENALGRSEAASVDARTEHEVPGGPPLDVEVQPTGSQSLKVIWKAPRPELRHGSIVGYYVGYRAEDPVPVPFQYKNVEVGQEDETETPLVSYLTNLRRLTRYSVIVQAYNDVGAGPRSDEVAATTLEAAPPTSPVLRLQSVTSSSISVTWDRQREDTGPREYVLHYRAEGDEGWSERPLTTERSVYRLSGLRCGTGYRLYMTATNSLGTGEPGDVLAARTQGAAPLSPRKESFVSANATRATLHLGAWSSVVCPVLRFEVALRSLAPPSPWETVPDPRGTTAELRRLLPDREYAVRVSAHSEAGTTEAEYRFRTANATTAPHAPDTATGGVRHSQEGGGVPFHRNLAIVLPVVISVSVLLVVTVSVVVCLRRTPPPHEEGVPKGRRQQERLGLSEFPRKGSKADTSSYVLAKSSYYASPALTEQHRHTGDSPHTIKKYSGWS